LSNSGGVNTPIGAIGGIYRIGDTDRVYFSQGNLQYQASTNTWRFAENQWDFVGEGLEFGNVFENGVKCDNELIAPDYNGWIDLFGWGTSGYDHGAVCYQPWSTDTGSGYYNAYGQSSYNLYDQTGQADWGYNAISNGGNQENMWRTLTREEWYYVFYLRNTSSGIRWARATVNGVNGIIILPDNWTSIYPIYDGNGNGGGYDSNIISATSWTNILEANGAVFLPVTRIRYETDVYTDYGDYWSASHYDTSFAYDVCFNDSLVDPMMYEGLLFYFRCNGYGVRLVCPAE
ncbi:MAG: hypothetical protein II100_05605, partial [Prevotella sp.]|nr:hypothetical protein [Prevotella sp.]